MFVGMAPCIHFIGRYSVVFMRFRVVVEREAAVAAEVAAAHAGHVSRQQWQAWRRWVNAARSGGQRSERAEQAAAERVRRIAAGEWVFSRADLVRLELDRLIKERGWRQRRWKPVPAGVAEAPGRRWGVTTRRYDGVVHVDIDERTGTLVRRVAYHSSHRATRELQRFVDRHGRGPAVAHDPAPTAAELGLLLLAARMPTADELSERAYWQTQVVTTADILREAIYRAGRGYQPPDPAAD